MSDIVERLRGFEGTEIPLEALAVVLEAAAEIERLRNELDVVKEELCGEQLLAQKGG